MISFPQALDIIARAVQPLAAQRVPTSAALGTTIAADVHTEVAVPGFANAAMDGYALRSAGVARATPGTPVELPVAGSIVAGDPAPIHGNDDIAWEITTGAPMPAGCDAVLPVERAELSRSSTGQACLRVTEPLRPGTNRREAGSDFRVGDLVARAGTQIDARLLMALAATGIDVVQARPTPRIGILVTGNELASSGLPDNSGRIRDANGPYLVACLTELGLPPALLRRARDDADEIRRELQALAADCDLVLTTGGVSAGRLDFLPGTVRDLGGEILFHKVAIRPGKPLLLARLPGSGVLCGLPGNPMAVAVGMRFFATAALRALMGLEPEGYRKAVCTGEVRKRRGLTFFAKAHAAVDTEARLHVEVLPGQESFRIAPLLDANCWAIIPEGREDVAAGEIIETAPLLPTGFPATRLRGARG